MARSSTSVTTYVLLGGAAYLLYTLNRDGKLANLFGQSAAANPLLPAAETTFVYPLTGQTVGISQGILVKTTPVANAPSYVYEFRQNGRLIASQVNVKPEAGLYPSPPTGHQLGPMQITARPDLPGARTTTITVQLI